MNFKLRHIATAVCVTASMVAASAASAEDTIQMGAVLSLTGSSATVGEDVRRAVDIAVDEINDDGGVLGKKFEVIVEDSAGNTTSALNAARKLVSVDEVPVIIGEYSSGITLPMAQYIVKEGVNHINVASTSVKIRDLGDTAFNLIGLEDAGNKFSSSDVYSQGMKRIALIAPNNAYGQGVAEGFRDEYEKLGGEIVSEILYTEGQSTYRRELQQMARTKPDGYVYTAYPQEAAVMNREASELGLQNDPWYGILLSMCLSDTPDDIAEGQIGMEVGSLRGDKGEAYKKTFTERHPDGMKSSYTGYAYDAVMMTAKAIEQAGSTDVEAVTEALKEVGQDYEGVTGEITFDDDLQRIDPPYDALISKDGEIVRR